jgi:alpha,alpha-trehalase
MHYVEVTGDTEFLSRMMPVMDREYQFWIVNRTVQVVDSAGKVHFMTHYRVINDAPRPESYVEDLYLVKNLNEDEKKRVFSKIASGAEFGWDFSSKYFDGEVTADPHTRTLPAE